MLYIKSNLKIRFLQAFLLVVNYSYSQDLTIPEKSYTDSIKIDNIVQRKNNKYPLSDQKNKQNWKLLNKDSDEFQSSKLNVNKWYPNNPKWKGRPPTFFHSSNVTLEKGELVIKVNKHGTEKLPPEFTHTTGFIKSKKRFLYGYFEAEVKLMDAPWVSGFWMTNASEDWWTEIDICENAPGVINNRHDLNSNLHVFKAPKDKGDVQKHFALNKKYYFPKELQTDYHVWGLEWTKDFIRFYIDGILFREAKNTHWHQPLEVNFNCESNKWFGALPDNNRIDGEYHVKYFRVWKSKNNKSIY